LISALSAPVDLTTDTPRLGGPLDCRALHQLADPLAAIHLQKISLCRQLAGP
jgi:hypothetical protein